MKRLTVFFLAILMFLMLVGCSGKTTDIEGTISGYVLVQEYTDPLIVINGNDKTFYVALVGVNTVAMDVDNMYETLLDGILNGEITDIGVHIEEAEKGKTIKIDGHKVTVWQSHQIQKLEQ